MSCGNCDCPFHELQAGYGPFASDEIQCMVSETVQKAVFDKGEILFRQGETSSSLYSLTDGMVKICSHTADGREQIVGLSVPGNLLVGLQSISDDRYAYTASATTLVHACKINHRALLARVRDRGDLAMRLIGAVNAQLAHSRALMEIMGQKCAAAKIASFILHMVPRSQHDGHRVSIPFSRLEIASLLGLSEETVCRLMADMRRNALIHAPRGRIEICDWDRLRGIADGSSGSRLTA